LERIRISSDGRGFEGAASGLPFIPIGFNYDHDEAGRLLEDYWEAEWAKVEEDFAEIKALGCYHKKDTPAWYDALEEEGRWAAQSAFWDAVAARCARSPAVFCFGRFSRRIDGAAPR
jgi:hypothetical protein